jgi:hypothetical protein
MEDTDKSWLVFPEYINILNVYFINSAQSSKYLKQNSDNKYLLINGLNTLTHVFNTILEQNLDTKLALDSMQKSIFYYIPFIEQMEENIMQDLNISSNSASIFVYKKTIGEMVVTLSENINDTQREFLNNVKKLQFIHRSLLDLFTEEIIPNFIPFFNELCKGYTDEKVFKGVLSNVIILLTHLMRENMDINKLYDIILIYIKQFKYHPLTVAGLCKKKTQPDYIEKLQNNNIKWLISA